MTTIRLFRGLLVLGSVAALQLAANAYAVDGDYSVKGKDFAGKAYTGKMTIKASGPIYRLTYKDGNTQRGMGILKGGYLFASWGPNNKCTISALEFKADSMEGPWADNDHPVLGTETLKRQAGASGEVAGTYSSSGKDTDANDYTGITTIEARGAAYKVTFRGDGEKLEGVAVKRGNYVSISYGGKACGVTVYEIKKDGSLSGLYAEFGESKVGTEELTKGW